MNNRIAELETLITKYQKAFYDGESPVSDAEFDALWDELKSLAPKSPKLRQVGAVKTAEVGRKLPDEEHCTNKVAELENYKVAFDDDEMTDEEYDTIWDELKKNPHSDHPLVEKFAFYSGPEPFSVLQAQTIQAEPFWENIDHKDPEQLKRQKYARRVDIVMINKKEKAGIFHSSSYWSTYNASLESCTCTDFEQRKLPCKHIYRLAYELGIIERPQKKPSGIGKADKETTRKDIGLPPGKVFHIQYEDSKGDISERDIEIQKIAEVKDKTYIYAYCHLHKATRSFLASRIMSISYYGRPVKDIRDLFQMDFSTPEDFIDRLVKEALEIAEPSDKTEELKKIPENSELLKSYIPNNKKKLPLLNENIKTIKAIDQFIEPFIKNTEYWNEYENKDDGSEYLIIYMRKYYKNGKPYKRPTMLSYIRYEPYHYGHFDESGEFHEEVVVCAKNKMPYAVDGQAYGYLVSAGRAFLKKLKEDLNINIP
jgi:hypothetical protein